MAVGRYFSVNDYDLAFNLQKHFHEYVAIYTSLHYPDSKKPLPTKERGELTLKLEESITKINLLAMKMRQLQPDIATADYQASEKQTVMSAPPILN